MHVCQASVSDLEDIAALFDEYRMFYMQESDLEGAWSFLSERMALAESVLFVARNQETNQAVGFAQLYPSFSSVSMQRLFILNDLFVLHKYRKQGAARLMLEAARTYAVDMKVKGLELSTSKDNDTAQRLYEQFGYEKDLEFDHYFLRL
ncbi:GNAT family N-acetyltransferase [Paenibacillus sp. HJL G12]|uniref:GNAT family N-acetyltransferase n=1 Tax=Paenibacillus dendrobii TaxID=2691084 RepID=A0A7X3LHJ5_9BACL|nr:GNAT family N-acetyltransferase [Paenibacillus dendrobii]